MYKSLQAGRGIAALLVVLFHLNGSIFGHSEYWPRQAWAPFAAGHAGVHFFFVLSGYIMLLVHGREAGDLSKLAVFAKKRFLRIYPVYWVVLLAIIPIYFIKEDFGEGYETQGMSIFTSLTLLPYQHDPILGVAWTLRHEILFYAFFSLIFVSLRVGVTAMAAWLAVCLAVSTDPSAAFPIKFFFSSLNLLFFFGMIAAWLNVKTAPRYCGSIFLAGVLAFGVAGYLDVTQSLQGPLLDWLFGIGSALAIVGAVELERTGRIAIPAFLQKIGDASYSIYLVHFIVLSLLAKIYFRVGGGQFPAAVGFVVLFVGAAFVGFIFHVMVEKQLLRFLNGKVLKKRSSAVMA
jgi:peptidoglycan/LPS O-acetylase OafA/YrhL